MAVEKVGQIYICENCGNEVIITKIGKGTLTCCNKEMKLIQDESIELYSEEDEESEE